MIQAFSPWDTAGEMRGDSRSPSTWPSVCMAVLQAHTINRSLLSSHDSTGQAQGLPAAQCAQAAYHPASATIASSKSRGTCSCPPPAAAGGASCMLLHTRMHPAMARTGKGPSCPLHASPSVESLSNFHTCSQQSCKLDVSRRADRRLTAS